MSGRVDRRGRAAALPSLGPSENITARGTFLGAPREREIAEFTERGPAMPAHASGSDRRSRCAPAPEIPPDGAGDAAFVKKAERRLEEGRAGILALTSRRLA